MPKRIIYKAIHRESGKIYIGATSKSLEERKEDHIQKANNGVGSYFHEAIGTYGSEAFEWEQIDTANDSNELAEKEKRFILEYKSQENGFNLDAGGGFKKKVYQYDVDTASLLAEYNSLQEAGDAIDAHKKCIAKACSGENRTCMGYFWSYQCPEKFDIPAEGRRKKVLQIDLEGNVINEYPSVSEASKGTGYSKSGISRVCRKERSQCGGYDWKYINTSNNKGE